MSIQWFEFYPANGITLGHIVSKSLAFPFLNLFSVGHFRIAFCLCVKTSLRASHSHGDVLRPQIHFHANQTGFLMKSFARRLVLEKRRKVTQERPIREVKYPRNL